MCLYSGDIEFFVHVKEENGGDIVPGRWGARGRHGRRYPSMAYLNMEVMGEDNLLFLFVVLGKHFAAQRRHSFVSTALRPNRAHHARPYQAAHRCCLDRPEGRHLRPAQFTQAAGRRSPRSTSIHDFPGLGILQAPVCGPVARHAPTDARPCNLLRLNTPLCRPRFPCTDSGSYHWRGQLWVCQL